MGAGGICGITGLDKLQKLQNRAARIVKNSHYNASALPIIRKLGWQTVNDLNVEETLKMVYKCENDEAPSYLACLFGRLSETSTRELRNTKTDLRVPFLRTTCGQKCFFLLEGRNYGMALMQNQNYQKISNNFKSVSKTLEHEEPILFLPIDNYF